MNINSSHLFKIELLDPWNLCFLTCINCKCSIQLNGHTAMFSMSDEEPPILLNEYLTCEEVQIKKLLE